MRSPRINIYEFDTDAYRGCGRARQEIRVRKRADKTEQRLVLAETGLCLLASQAYDRCKLR